MTYTGTATASTYGEAVNRAVDNAVLDWRITYKGNPDFDLYTGYPNVTVKVISQTVTYLPYGLWHDSKEEFSAVVEIEFEEEEV